MVTVTSPRAKAERCFAVARSTTFAGERENAIAQGKRIAEAAGLDLDTFDIPGRTRGKAKAQANPDASNPYFRTASGDTIHGFAAAFHDFGSPEFRRAARGMAEEMRRQREAQPTGEELARAKATRDRVRKATEAARDAAKAAQEQRNKERERQAETHRILADAVAGVAWKFGLHVEARNTHIGRRWSITGPDGKTRTSVSDERLYDLAASW